MVLISEEQAKLLVPDTYQEGHTYYLDNIGGTCPIVICQETRQTVEIRPHTDTTQHTANAWRLAVIAIIVIEVLLVIATLAQAWGGS